MCGRARCTLNPGQVARACGLSSAAAASVPTHQIDRYRPSFNVSPGSYMPVFVPGTQRGGTEGKTAVPTVHCMKWGLIPSFTKKTDKPDHYRMFNARSESVKEKASFRRLIPTNRCLVAVEGFYEWKKDGSKKQPYYIHLKDDRPLVFAALYDSWGNSEGEILYTFTILTTRCSSSLEWLHDRMPVILGGQNSIDLWLNEPTPNFETLLVPYEEHDLVWHPVTPAVGKPSFNGPECIKEIQLKSAVEAPLLKFFSKKIDEKAEPKGETHELPQEFEGINSSDGVKEEPADEEKNIKSDNLILVQKGTTEPNIYGIKNEFEGINSSDGVKEEPADEEKKINSDNLIPVQKGATEPNIYGIKNEFEEIPTGSGLTVAMFDSLHPDPPKKKSKNLKNAGDGQASLLSYFGKK